MQGNIPRGVAFLFNGAYDDFPGETLLSDSFRLRDMLWMHLCILPCTLLTQRFHSQTKEEEKIEYPLDFCECVNGSTISFMS